MGERRMLLNKNDTFVSHLIINYNYTYSNYNTVEIMNDDNIKYKTTREDKHGVIEIMFKNEFVLPYNFIYFPKDGIEDITFQNETDNLITLNTYCITTDSYIHNCEVYGKFEFKEECINSKSTNIISIYGPDCIFENNTFTKYVSNIYYYDKLTPITIIKDGYTNIYAHPHILYDLMKYNNIEEGDVKAQKYHILDNTRLYISSPTNYITTIPNVDLSCNNYIKSVNNYMYEGKYITEYICDSDITFPKKGITLPRNSTVYFPDTVADIDDDTFKYESNLKKVIVFSNCILSYLGGFMGSDVRNIISFKKFNGIGFEGLRETKIEKIPDGYYENIGDRALLSCSNLKDINIYLNGLLYIGESAFEGTDIDKVMYYGTLEQWCISGFSSNPTEISNNLYINDEKLVNLTIPDNITVLQQYTFCGITLDNVDLNKVEIIDGRYALYITCNYINIPNTLKEINGDYGFHVNTKELNICDLNNYLNITGDIDNPLFSRIEKLYINNIYTEDLIIPENITVLKKYLLSKIPIKSVNAINVINIEDMCFSNTITLNVIKLSNKLKNIGYFAFYNIGDLTIEYDGTKEEWNNIIKDEHWNTNTNITYIFKNDVE